MFILSSPVALEKKVILTSISIPRTPVNRRYRHHSDSRTPPGFRHSLSADETTIPATIPCRAHTIVLQQFCRGFSTAPLAGTDPLHAALPRDFA